MPKRIGRRTKKQPKRKYEKPISLYGVPLEEAVRDILKSPPVPMDKKDEKRKP